MRIGASVRAAVESALATRTRPIVLTTLTTLFGMLPLVLIPGPGSVLYRGLGTVLVGGMAVNSVFTLLLLPTLLRLAKHSNAAAPAALKPMEAVEPANEPATQPSWTAARVALVCLPVPRPAALRTPAGCPWW